MYHDGRNIPVMSGQIQEGKNLVMEEKNGVTGTGNMGFLPSPSPPTPSRPVNLGQGILTLNFPATKCYNMCQTSLLFQKQKTCTYHLKIQRRMFERHPQTLMKILRLHWYFTEYYIRMSFYMQIFMCIAQLTGFSGIFLFYDTFLNFRLLQISEEGISKAFQN